MRLIDANALREAMYHEAFETDSEMQKWNSGCWIRYKMFENNLDSAPSIDAEPVIRCRDCFWYTDSTKAIGDGPNGEVIEWCICLMFEEIMPENGYCSRAERIKK